MSFLLKYISLFISCVNVMLSTAPYAGIMLCGPFLVLLYLKSDETFTMSLQFVHPIVKCMCISNTCEMEFCLFISLRDQQIALFRQYILQVITFFCTTKKDLFNTHNPAEVRNY